MNSYYMTFKYATTGKPYELGRGILGLWHLSVPLLTVQARTGSVDGSGQLVNAIVPYERWIREKSQDTEEPAMVLGGIGWKIRLWDKEGTSFRFTHFLIHPDGGLPGSKGCIVTPTICLELRDRIDDILFREQDKIPLYINQEVTLV